MYCRPRKFVANFSLCVGCLAASRLYHSVITLFTIAGSRVTSLFLKRSAKDPKSSRERPTQTLLHGARYGDQSPELRKRRLQRASHPRSQDFPGDHLSYERDIANPANLHT